ncbi:MAG: hypothetical protein ACYSTG_00675 [Planctomycetota bacterium]|jgi:hypothetical protein
MAKSKCSKITIAAALLVLFIAASLQAQTSADELLRIVPADSLFCVRINHFDYTLSQIDQFLAGVSPIPMGTSMLVRMQLAQLFGSPQLQGINMGGTFAIFGTLAPGEPIQPNQLLSILVPVTDYKQFVSGNPNVGPPDEKGVSKISRVGGVVTQAGNFALIKPPGSYDKLVKLAKSIKERRTASLATALDAAEAKQAIQQPIWIYGNIQQVSKTLGPLLFAKIEQTKKMMTTFPAGTGPMGSPEKMIDIYIKLLETLIKETKSLTIALNPKPDVLNITKIITAMPGTDMANMFVTDTSAKKENKLLGYLEDGAVMNMAARMNVPCCKKFYDKAFDLFAPIFGDTIPAEDIAKMKALAANTIDSLGGAGAASSSIDSKHKPPFALKYVLEVKDADKFNKTIEESIKLWNQGALADFYKKTFGMGMDYSVKLAADTYKGVSIDSAKLVMKSTNANSPQAQMIAAMYGDSCEYRWAIVDGLCVFAIGGDADSAVRSLIDQVKAGGPKQLGSEMKAALALIPGADKADVMGTFNYVRVLKMLPAMMGAMMPVPMPEVDFPTKSNIAFAGTVGDGKLTFGIAIPKQHLAEIMAAFQMMMQHQMQQMQKQSTPMPR